ncbi:MAG TPA: LPXTG cell wall anchor domain-containing protein [Acidimicrobiia bacterium]|nr:LPXTG cell wall anchor domain-containing protein [Acidimicrobiia bacterium]
MTFSVSVKNESPIESVTLTALTDVPYGNVAVKAGNILDTTCVVPQTIAAGASYVCSFRAAVAGDAGAPVRDVLTARAQVRDLVLTDDDDAIVTITDVKPLLQVDKSVSPGELKEPGGTVTFKVDVKNLSKENLTLNSLTDNKYGSLAAKGTCSVPQTIAPGATYTCTFDERATGDPRTPHVNTATGKAIDNENNEVIDTGEATVRFTDVVPKLVVDKSVSPSQLPEPGGKVTYTVVVTNPHDAIENIDLTALQDDRFGNLQGVGTCDVDPAVPLAPGAKYSCTFEKELTGNAKATHLNTVTATIRDDDGNTITDTDDALVEFTDALPRIEVEKTADPVTVPEPGGDVTFGVKIINPVGAAEPVTITSLVDDVYGNLAGKGSCLPAATTLVLAPGATYSCSFTVFVGPGKPDETRIDTIAGKAVDDEGNIAEDKASATVTITDVLPKVEVIKTADPTSVPETGGPVTFTVRVKNPADAVEPIVLSELTDSVYGDLTDKGCDLTPAVSLDIGKEYVCTFTQTVKGDFPEVHKNTVTAAAEDDEENRATDTDDADVALTDVIPSILVDKAALPATLPEPGGNVTYAVAVTNTSLETVTLTQLVDDLGRGPVSLAGKGTCLQAQPVTIAPGATYSCTFTAPVNGEARSVHTDTVTATAEDDEKNPVTDEDSATVTITDVPPAIVVDKGAAPSEIGEPGGTVNFTVVVTNTSAVDAVTLTSLVDNVYGNLDGKGTCNLATAGPIAVDGHYTCTFPGPVSGNAGSTHDDTVTAVAADNDGTSTPPVTDKATVTILNVAPEIVVDKLASPGQIPEPGGTVNFTVTVTNPGTAEALTLSSLNDDVYGNLNGKGDCQVPQTIATGGFYTCTFPGDVKGDAGSTHSDTVTAVATDDDGSEVSDAARATVTVIDVKPTVLVAKSAAPSTLREPGGTATFTVTVTNPANAVEPIKLTGLVDSVFGSLNGDGTCDVPVDLAPGEQYTCSFTGPVAGNGGDTHTNEVTGTAQDNEENKATGKDTADVDISDVLPTIKIDKTAGASSVHAGDSVTYTYVVHNLGVEPLRDVAVADDKCSPAKLTGGDADSDDLLDLTEAWTFTCTAKLTGTTTNIATGTGKDDEDNTATDQDTETVNVIDPKIVIDKVASLTQIGAGDPVTYTYTVTNPGNAPLADVTVTDDKCGPVILTGGDTDSDALLDPGEMWKFTCTATLSSPGQITNTARVRGKDPIGQEVSATDTAVVSVLETIVLPARETQPGTLLPAPAAPQPTLPVTGRDLMHPTASGLALVTGGLLLRRRRKRG